MNVEALFALLQEAKRLCGHSQYVVIGSLSVLGVSDVTAIPGDMTMSIDADCYTLLDPGRALDLQADLGEGSTYHVEHGIYLDPGNPNLPTLPPGWQDRLIEMERDGVVALFLEPHDAAVSKLTRGEERDIRWVLAGVRSSILSIPTMSIRMKATSFLDDEQSAAMDLLNRVIAQAQESVVRMRPR